MGTLGNLMKLFHAIKRKGRDLARPKPDESQKEGGFQGEKKVIEELLKLPDEFHVFNDVNIQFSNYIRNKKTGKYIKHCQIDHIVLGYNGIFLIETKNWSLDYWNEKISGKFPPHAQISRNGYAFFVWLMRISRFPKKVPIRQIVATIKPRPLLDFPYVKQLDLSELNGYIKYFQDVLSPSDYTIIQRLLLDKCSEAYKVF